MDDWTGIKGSIVIPAGFPGAIFLIIQATEIRLIRKSYDLFMGNLAINPHGQAPTKPHCKTARRICERYQAAKIRIQPDGPYSCNQCGYDYKSGKHTREWIQGEGNKIFYETAG